MRSRRPAVSHDHTEDANDAGRGAEEGDQPREARARAPALAPRAPAREAEGLPPHPRRRGLPRAPRGERGSGARGVGNEPPGHRVPDAVHGAGDAAAAPRVLLALAARLHEAAPRGARERHRAEGAIAAGEEAVSGKIVTLRPRLGRKLPAR